ncbi:hypothetical protein BUE80_DR003916 [Diplocarpon rosae]|nr:hypothetical protein BUE80_DR003916 [Diplocarpon rosae]
MGLPLFITPTEPEVASKIAEKIAAGPRSSIRRNRPLRISQHAARRRVAPDVVEVEESELPEIQQNTHPDQIEVFSSNSVHRQMHERARERMRESYNLMRQQSSSNTQDSHFMPPVPESRDYTGADETQREIYRARQLRLDLRRLGRRHPAPTPPYTDGDLAPLSRTDSPRLSSSVTPVLSPSHQPLTTGRIESPWRIPLEEAVAESTSTEPLLTEPLSTNRSTLSQRIHALSRTANNTGRSLRLARPRLDGLGDRDRSFSPEGGAAWDTLLTSITPDPQPPSAGSSFASTSAAAAAASSSESGPSSTSTSLTSLDRVAVEPECDVSETESNAEEDEDIYGLDDDLHHLSRHRGERLWRTYAEVVTARADLATRNDTEHLGGLHRIISRMARRDDVPETWWASAGLSRNLRPDPSN